MRYECDCDKERAEREPRPPASWRNVSEVGSCNGCTDDTRKVYEIRLRSQLVRLCQKCADSLTASLKRRR